MSTKGGIKLNGLLASAIYGKPAAGKAPKARKKHGGRGRMENEIELKTADDVDKESRPVNEDMEGNNKLLSPGIMSTQDTLSLSQIPNVVNHSKEKSNGSIHSEEMIQSCKLDLNHDSYNNINGQPSDNNSDIGSNNRSAQNIAKQLKAKFKANKEKSTLHTGITLNNVSGVRKESLSVPTTACNLETPCSEGPGSRRDSNASGLSQGSQTSPRSNDRRVDYIVVPVQHEEKKSVYSQEDSWIRGAIPYLPPWVAYLCLVLNIIIPGSGKDLVVFSYFKILLS